MYVLEYEIIMFPLNLDIAGSYIFQNDESFFRVGIELFNMAKVTMFFFHYCIKAYIMIIEALCLKKNDKGIISFPFEKTMSM